MPRPLLAPVAAAAGAVVLALCAAPAPAAASGTAAAPASSTGQWPGCTVTVPPPTPQERDLYLCGDPRLGPAELPRGGVVGELLTEYDRLGALTPVAFVARHRETGVDNATGEVTESWRYPAHDGFAVENGEVQRAVETVREGTLLDRFGSARGSFLAPADTPFPERALPPDSLNTWPGGPEHNYRCYAVTEDFAAEVGPIAPAFEQPGGGEQVLLGPDLVPEAGGLDRLGADSMVEWGYLDVRPARECDVDGAAPAR
ncbi:TNT domain-containing protein [Streptomonospora sp. S1-112]|uniref:TNT domain-containing protein n=1 Tax=Streptomonospora mangrovi TaxID=2883123 RepID=A0A9X3SDR4_9ACTN|nr:TNT domain-containing protein [Streptomonospora mangrovi]MDA0565138.1 TNT domain-containing protein [Streptomonospora mangrovi]